MICSVASYRWVEGAHFDHDYYQNEHMRIAKSLLMPLGLRKLLSHKMLMPKDRKAGVVVAQTHAYFDSVDAVKLAIRQAGAELLADVENYTNIRPESYVFEVTEHLEALST
jgi:uncharacterized protein (TIGR02118 family)